MGNWMKYQRDAKYQRIVRNMKQKSYDFGCIYQDYYQDKCDEEVLTKVATQPYWQSLRLNKKRLDENGIQMQVRIKDKGKTVIDVKDFEDNGKTTVGTFKRIVTMDKAFVRNGKKLFRKKERSLCLSNVIQASGEGDLVACPNCGNRGKISSYIDGCDFCNSKFQVEEFEEKISSFHLEEDTSKKTRALTSTIVVTVFLSLIAMVLALIGLFIYALVSDVTTSTDMNSYYFGILAILSIEWIPRLAKLFVISIIIFIVFTIMYMKRNYTRVKKNTVTKQIAQQIAGFVPEHFAQELEYKLRNIHFAEQAGEVNAFAKIDLRMAMEKYRDVVECVLEKLEFIHQEARVEGLFVTMKVGVKLFRYRNGKIKEENEKITLVMSARWDMHSALTEAVHMYCCGGCGASVSLLEGGRCGYCGEKLDYAKYSWMIEAYYSNLKQKEVEHCTEPIAFSDRKYMDGFKKVKMQLAAIYFGICLVGIGTYCIQCKDTIYHALNYNVYIEKFEEACLALKKLDDCSNMFQEVDFTKIAFEMEYRYTFDEDYMQAIADYEAYLETEGYTLVQLEKKKDIYSKPLRMNEEYLVYHVVSIEYQEDEIIVYYAVSEEEDGHES